MSGGVDTKLSDIEDGCGDMKKIYKILALEGLAFVVGIALKAIEEEEKKQKPHRDFIGGVYNTFLQDNCWR